MRLHERTGPGRAVCPLCRVELCEAPEGLETCAGCEVRYHGDCLQELGGCATLGCAREGQVPAGAGERSFADEALAALRARHAAEEAEVAALSDAELEERARRRARLAEQHRQRLEAERAERAARRAAERASPPPTARPTPAAELHRLALREAPPPPNAWARWLGALLVGGGLAAAVAASQHVTPHPGDHGAGQPLMPLALFGLLYGGLVLLLGLASLAARARPLFLDGTVVVGASGAWLCVEPDGLRSIGPDGTLQALDPALARLLAFDHTLRLDPLLARPVTAGERVCAVACLRPLHAVRLVQVDVWPT